MTKLHSSPSYCHDHALSTTPSHLDRCGANPPGPWPAQTASHEDDPPTQKQDSHSCHLLMFPEIGL